MKVTIGKSDNRPAVIASTRSTDTRFCLTLSGKPKEMAEWLLHKADNKITPGALVEEFWEKPASKWAVNAESVIARHRNTHPEPYFYINELGSKHAAIGVSDIDGNTLTIYSGNLELLADCLNVIREKAPHIKGIPEAQASLKQLENTAARIASFSTVPSPLP